MDETHERVRQLCINEQSACEPSWLKSRRVLTGCMACQSRVLAHECVAAALLNLSLLHSCLLWLPTDCLVGWSVGWRFGRLVGGFSWLACWLHVSPPECGKQHNSTRMLRMLLLPEQQLPCKGAGVAALHGNHGIDKTAHDMTGFWLILAELLCSLQPMMHVGRCDWMPLHLYHTFLHSAVFAVA